MVLLSVLEAMSASTRLAGVESHVVRDWCFHLLVVHSTEETGASSEPAILKGISRQRRNLMVNSRLPKEIYQWS